MKKGRAAPEGNESIIRAGRHAQPPGGGAGKCGESIYRKTGVLAKAWPGDGRHKGGLAGRGGGRAWLAG
jgi:hypothetical protein